MSASMKPVHPGEQLAELLARRNITGYRLAKDIEVSQDRIYSILRCERPITADTARRLALYTGVDAQSWLNLQAHYDLESVRDHRDKALERRIRERRQSRGKSEAPA